MRKIELIVKLEALPDDAEILVFSPNTGTWREPETKVHPNITYKQKPLVQL